MNAPSPSLYDHLTEVELVMDALHPVLDLIAREHGAELRWMYVGGTRHGVTLFVSPIFPVALPLRWDGLQYELATPLNQITPATHPHTFSVLVDALLRVVFRRGGAR